MRFVFFFTLLFSQFVFADAVIFSGNDVKALKYNLDLFGRSKILGLNSDPSSGGGQAAPLGSIGMDYLTGNVYIKNGAGNTNWVDITGSITGTANTAAAYDANGVLNPLSTVDTTEMGYLDGVTSSLCGATQSCTLSSKSIDADSNTITNIENADIKAGAAIDAAKIADGTVSSTEFQYINTLSSNAQTQIDGKASTTLNNLGTTAINANLTFGSGIAGLLSTAVSSASPRTPALTIGTGANTFVGAGGEGSGDLILRTGDVDDFGTGGDIQILSGAAGLGSGDILLRAGLASSSATIGDATVQARNINLKAYGGPTGGEYAVNVAGPDSEASQAAIRLFEAGDLSTSQYAGIKAPASLSSSYTLTLPSDDGTTGYLLQSSDGAGGTSWIEATDQSTASTIVKRDSSGYVEINRIRNSTGNDVYRPDNATIRTGAGVLNIDHSSAEVIFYNGYKYGNPTNLSASSLITFNTTTNAGGGTSYTLTWPPAQGASGQFLQNNGSGTLSWSKEILGVTNASNATAGYVGEIVESTGSINCPTSTQYGDITSITLSAGDWDVFASFVTSYGSTATGNALGGIGTASGNDGSGLSQGDTAIVMSAAAVSGGNMQSTVMARKNITGSTTYYLKGSFTYSSGTPICSGKISARRVR